MKQEEIRYLLNRLEYYNKEMFNINNSTFAMAHYNKMSNKIMKKLIKDFKKRKQKKELKK